MSKESKDCSACDGSGTCSRCGGVGKISKDVMDSTLGRLFNVRPDCPSCKGSGKCNRCKGRGYFWVNK